MQVHNFINEEVGFIEVRCLVYDDVDAKVQVQDLIKVCPFYYPKLPTKFQAFFGHWIIEELNKT